MKSTTIQLCRDVFFASGKRFDVYLNSVKDKVGTCELNDNNSLDITFEEGYNFSADEKYVYLIAPNKHELPQSEFYALLIIN